MHWSRLPILGKGPSNDLSHDGINRPFWMLAPVEAFLHVAYTNLEHFPYEHAIAQNLSPSRLVANSDYPRASVL
jgi:hypothetical protein